MTNREGTARQFDRAICAFRALRRDHSVEVPEEFRRACAYPDRPSRHHAVALEGPRFQLQLGVQSRSARPSPYANARGQRDEPGDGTEIAEVDSRKIDRHQALRARGGEYETTCDRGHRGNAEEGRAAAR